MVMQHVGIYRTIFPLPSETFIAEQASNLTNYEPKFIIRSKPKNTDFQNVSISDRDFLKVKQILFTLTRNSTFLHKSPSLKDLDIIHAHFGPDGVYVMPLANALDLPLVVTMHGYDTELYRKSIHQPWDIDNPLKYQSIQFLLNERKLQNRASVFIAVSGFIRDKLVQAGYPKEKVVLHYIGVDTEKFVPSTESPYERYIFCVGRHAGKKGIDTLLKAFARIAKKHPTVKLLQVGGGDPSATSNLHRLANELGLREQVNFLGTQPNEKVLHLMRNAEIFALPSQTTESGDTEGLPFAIKEASACGIPVVSTWHSGIPEAVLDGETGFLVQERDDKSLAEKLDILLLDRPLGKQMGKRGREYICENFNIYKQTLKLEQIYDQAIEGYKTSAVKREQTHQTALGR